MMEHDFRGCADLRTCQAAPFPSNMGEAFPARLSADFLLSDAPITLKSGWIKPLLQTEKYAIMVQDAQLRRAAWTVLATRGNGEWRNPLLDRESTYGLKRLTFSPLAPAPQRTQTPTRRLGEAFLRPAGHPFLSASGRQGERLQQDSRE